jgi:hypothetical protein
MLLPFTFLSTVNRSSGELVNVSAQNGAWVTFTGAIPTDLRLTAYDSTGAPTVEDFPIAPGDTIYARFVQLRLTHAPVTSGAAFVVVVAFGDERYTPSTRQVTQLYRIGSGPNDLVPARISTQVKGVLTSASGVGINVPQATLWTPSDPSKRFRMLGLRVIIPGWSVFHSFDANGFVGFSSPGGFSNWYLSVQLPTAAAAGAVHWDSGLISLGDGLLTAPGASVLAQVTTDTAGTTPARTVSPGGSTAGVYFLVQGHEE